MSDKPVQSKPASKPAPWSERFDEPVADLVQRYTSSVQFDRRLATHDILGSLAHARMLQAAGIISAADLVAIERGMQEIGAEIAADKFVWRRDLEDVHLNHRKPAYRHGGRSRQTSAHGPLAQ
jgi:argininosuccinate lyase